MYRRLVGTSSSVVVGEQLAAGRRVHDSPDWRRHWASVPASSKVAVSVPDLLHEVAVWWLW